MALILFIIPLSIPSGYKAFRVLFQDAKDVLLLLLAFCGQEYLSILPPLGRSNAHLPLLVKGDGVFHPIVFVLHLPLAATSEYYYSGVLPRDYNLLCVLPLPLESAIFPMYFSFTVTQPINT